MSGLASELEKCYFQFQMRKMLHFGLTFPSFYVSNMSKTYLISMMSCSLRPGLTYCFGLNLAYRSSRMLCVLLAGFIINCISNYNIDPHCIKYIQMLPTDKLEKSESSQIKNHLQGKIEVNYVGQSMHQSQKHQKTEQYEEFQNQFFDSEVQEANKQLDQKQEDTPNSKNLDGKHEGKASKLNSAMLKLSLSINELKQKYSDFDVADLLSKKRNVKKQEQARSFIKKKIEEKKQQMKRMKSIKKQEQQKRKALEQLKIKETSLQKKKKIEEIKMLNQNKEESQRLKKYNEEKDKFVQEFYSKHKYDKKIHQIFEKEQMKKENKQAEFKKAYLEKRKQKYRPFSENQFKDFMKMHQQKLKELSDQRFQQKIQKNTKIMQENVKLLSNIYRSKRYEKIQMQTQTDHNFEKRKSLTQKHKKIKEYNEYVKQNFKPQAKDSQQNEQQLLKPQQESQEQNPTIKKIKKDKYLHGKITGQIIELVRLPKSQAQQRRIGDGYLQGLKQLPKKEPVRAKSVNEIQPPSPKKIEIPRLPRPKNFNVKVSQNPSRQQISNILLQLKSKDHIIELKQKKSRIKALKREASFEDQQINDNIIQNIQRKLSLLNRL